MWLSEILPVMGYPDKYLVAKKRRYPKVPPVIIFWPP